MGGQDTGWYRPQLKWEGTASGQNHGRLGTPGITEDEHTRGQWWRAQMLT